MIEISTDLSKSQDLVQLREIYLDSFPPEERREWNQILEFAANPSHLLVLHIIYEEGRAVGFLTCWNFGKFYYIEHFAFNASVRGRGIGSRVLDMLKDNLSKTAPIVLEVEPEEQSEEARRRIGFYERRGFSVVDKSYIQPPYQPGLSSVPLWLMAYGKAPVDLTEATRVLHREVYGVR